MDPLWARVKMRELSFSDAVDTSNRFATGERIAIIILALHHHHSRYIDDQHFLFRLFDGGSVTDMSIYAYYLFSILCPDSDDEIVEGSDVTLTSLRITLPTTFRYDVLVSWITALMHSLFQCGPVMPSIDRYTSRDDGNLERAVAYHSWLKRHRLTFIDPVGVNGYYQLSLAHDHLVAAVDFVCGRSACPFDHVALHQAVQSSLWPELLARLNNDDLSSVSFDAMSAYSIDAVELITSQIESLFQDRPLLASLNDWYLPSPERDADRLCAYMASLDGSIRCAFTGSRRPVSDDAMMVLVADVRSRGVDAALHDILTDNKAQIDRDGTPENDQTLLGVPYWHYHPDDIVWVAEGHRSFAFLSSEIDSMQSRVNPYTQVALPPYATHHVRPSVSIVQWWETALHRSMKTNEETCRVTGNDDGDHADHSAGD